jgi:drug/metabolite transporter superfamily protein YnfA
MFYSVAAICLIRGSWLFALNVRESSALWQRFSRRVASRAPRWPDQEVVASEGLKL